GNIIAYFYKGTGLKERFLKYEAASEKVAVPAGNLALAGGPSGDVTTTKFQVLATEGAQAEPEHDHAHHHHGEEHTHEKMSFSQKVWHTVQHAVDEFFSVGKYLVFGALIAAAMQTYIKTSTLVSIGHGPILSILLMMVLAFVLSLCSEADAFIGASFRSVFSTQSIVAFLVFGPMLDIKNLMMMLGAFKAKFVLLIVTSVTIVVFLYALVI
ncbi:TPA: permease, partial [Listeria innocua]|nr:permease [Listeria innocua]